MADLGAVGHPAASLSVFPLARGFVPYHCEGALQSSVWRFPLGRSGWSIDRAINAHSFVLLGDLARSPPRYIEDLMKITAQVVAPGFQGLNVLVLHSASGRLSSKITPLEDGTWEAEVLPGSYTIAYRADLAAPICHGPYILAK
jgi:hypothetical protein